MFGRYVARLFNQLPKAAVAKWAQTFLGERQQRDREKELRCRTEREQHQEQEGGLEPARQGGGLAQ